MTEVAGSGAELLATVHCILFTCLYFPIAICYTAAYLLSPFRMPAPSPQAIAKQDAIVKALVTDLAGGFKEIIFPSRQLPELISSGIAYDGSSFQGINLINASDAILQGCQETLVQVPASVAATEKPEYWIICNILSTDGKPHPHCARSALLRLQGQLAKAWDGGHLYMGSEPEAYFVHPDNKHNIGENEGGNSNYFNPKDEKSVIIAEISNAMDEMGYDIERAHTEVGDDQFEINWKYDTAQGTADKIQIFKLLSHKIARKFGYDVTFLPKPYPSRNGSGMHCHISVGDGKQNHFFDASKGNQKHFSDTALQFLSGILHNARALCAIANSTEVSYARLVPGFEAPCIVAIGDCNRSAACRIPAIADEKMRKVALRTEFRFPDPLANPYLLAAGFIAAGLAGIQGKAAFGGFCEEDLYALSLHQIREKGYDLLPRNLWEAHQAFSASAVLAEHLGESLHSQYADLLLEEIDECQAFANAESMRRHYFS